MESKPIPLQMNLPFLSNPMWFSMEEAAILMGNPKKR